MGVLGGTRFFFLGPIEQRCFVVCYDMCAMCPMSVTILRRGLSLCCVGALQGHGVLLLSSERVFVCVRVCVCWSRFCWVGRRSYLGLSTNPKRHKFYFQAYLPIKIVQDDVSACFIHYIVIFC